MKDTNETRTLWSLETDTNQTPNEILISCDKCPERNGEDVLRKKINRTASLAKTSLKRCGARTRLAEGRARAVPTTEAWVCQGSRWDHS